MCQGYDQGDRIIDTANVHQGPRSLVHCPGYDQVDGIRGTANVHQGTYSPWRVVLAMIKGTGFLVQQTCTKEPVPVVHPRGLSL